MATRATWLLVLALAAACGDAVAKPKRAPQVENDAPVVAREAHRDDVAIEPVKIVSVTPPPAMSGALENAKSLHRFFDKLANLESGAERGDVRVLQFGDSHTLADFQSGAARKVLQNKFGDGGRGFVAVGRPFRYWVQDGVVNGMTSEWTTERGHFVQGKFTGDGLYGLGGASLVTSRRAARAWVETKSPVSSVDFAFLAQPRGGSLDLFVDGTKVGRVSTRADKPQSAFKSIDVEEGLHQLEVRTNGDGDVRLFGATLERKDRGIVYDAIGINGVRASIALTWSEAHMSEQLRHRSPDLVILAYGTNESTDDTSSEAYERQLVDVLGRIARAVPSASCLLLGPPDRAIQSSSGFLTSPRILEIIAVQRRVAEAAGCGFYSQFDAMGGEGSIASWALEDPPRAQHDRTHLTREGYTQMGSAFASDLLRAYAAYHGSAGKPEPMPQPAHDSAEAAK